MKNKIKVGILGATGSVGQNFIKLLQGHPWFEISELAASDRTAGKAYGEACDWFLTGEIPESVKDLKIKECRPNLDCKIVFSGLVSSVAREIEAEFAEAGYIVVSNAGSHRMESNIPLLIPEINPDHLSLLEYQKTTGKIVTNPNCSVIGMCMALKPIYDRFGIQDISVTTMQALSGAGFKGVSALQIIDNVIPYIGNEENKMESEPQKIFGQSNQGKIEYEKFRISASCNRVMVTDGHVESISLRLKEKVSREQLIDCWENFESPIKGLDLPTSPDRLFYYFNEDIYPQPRLHRMLGNGMSISIGRLRECNLMDYKFTVLSNNTIRGAAGCAVLNAELMYKKGYFD